ncbi:carbohydrate ABC transporter permease [Kibdelosporangium aridum]|uniref:Carbohydrate ABC transporter membrane protein 1, CUT1 family n=1 Tax=Kibdelosporangium aridum TaxID=2030 RepID=A0A1W2CIV1_KIBAR|nr:sugar ABC transporter permease [Kibdelosporangium aridum]SMC85111.1 carbohydrate ABC transporter membrane protein 1, CUT1 family [Kibdelosporangium aridum]
MTVHTELRPAAPPEPPAAKPFWTPRRRDALVGWAFIAPQVLGFFLFVLGPLIAVIWYSFQSTNLLAGTTEFAGLENYEHLLDDPVMPSVARATVLFCVGLVVLNLSLALLLAVLLNQKLHGTTVFRTIFFSPVVVSLVAWTIAWNLMLQDNGSINAMLQAVGIDGPNWLRGENSAMISVIVVQVIKNVGLNMVLFLAALQGVPRSLLEAAELDGAGPWRRFRTITLPMISPTTLLTAIITVSGALHVFAQIQILTLGGPADSTNVLVFYFYQQAFGNHDFGYGAVLAVVLFVIIALLTTLQWRMRKRWVFYEA